MSHGFKHALQRLPRTIFWWAYYGLNLAPPGLRSRIRKAMVRGWYEVVSSTDHESETTFLNLGSAPLEQRASALELTPEQEKDRLPIQLYAQVAGVVDLRGRDVLEVGCGRGGGSAFIMQHFGPRRMIGVDLAKSAVRFCRRRHRITGLSFFRGDAESLAFSSKSFDAVINLESSHGYPDMDRFLQEVARVLRPGGYFLFADLRPKAQVPTLREQLGRSGLIVLEEEQIAANVVRALELNHERQLAFIQRKIPWILRRAVQEFSGTRGSELYEQLRGGERAYLRFALQKPGGAGP